MAAVRLIDRRVALAVFYGAGSLLCGLSLLPHLLPAGRSVIAAIGIIAGTVSVGLVSARSLPPPLAQALVALGSGLIATAAWAPGGGLPSAGFAIFSLFVVTYAGLFFSTRSATAHVTGCLLAVAIALFAAGAGIAAVVQLLLLLGGTAISTAVVVRLLVARIDDLTTHDALTGLLNERGFCAAGGRDIAAATLDAPVVLLLLEVDNFAEMRAALGVDLTDELLRQIGAAALHGGGAEPTHVARLSGGTFAVLLRPPAEFRAAGPELVDIASLAAAVAASARGPYRVSAVEVDATVTIGAALCPLHGREPVALLRKATVALAAATLDGQAARLWSADTDETTSDALTLQAQLSRAVTAGELRLRYQPLIAAHSGTMVGVEALVRWQHPERGLLAPDTFLPHAERSPVIVELSEWVLNEAVRQAADWQRAGMPLSVSVNFSARLLVHDGLPALVTATLARHRVPAALLTVEVTESAVMTRPERATAMLAELRAMGARISIDDFGTGNTSLALLADLPVDELKVDRRFISGALVNTGDAAIVRAVVQLGHRLGLEVVGEGVEEEATRQLLAELDYDILQGYLFSRPTTPEDITARLRAQQEKLAARPAGTVRSRAGRSSEAARLRALDSYRILDTDGEQFFNDVATVAAYICGTPMALVSLVDEDRQWFKASVGVDVTETPRSQSFCAHSIDTAAMLEVPDATVDPRFADNPLVTGELGLRFYAGAPLTTSDGYVLGSLCVIDRVARTMTSTQRVALAGLARTVVAHLELRRRALWASTAAEIPAPHPQLDAAAGRMDVSASG